MTITDRIRPLAFPQWNMWTCGPAALRCALLCYGDRVDGRRLAILGSTDRENGADEDGLDEAAREFGFHIEHRTLRTVDAAFAEILGLLRTKTPVLLCVDVVNGEWTHWIAVVRGTSRHAWICDPARDETEVLRRVTWRVLLRRLHWGLPDELRFDVYPLVPI